MNRQLSVAPLPSSSAVDLLFFFRLKVQLILSLVVWMRSRTMARNAV